MKIADIKAITTAVKENNSDILVAVDNTFATPVSYTHLTLPTKA